MGRRSYAEGSSAKLLDLWAPPSESGGPVGCIATTYTFDASFFEEQCLARFAGIDGDPAEDPQSYLVEREERLSELRAIVMVDGANVPASRSLRWHVLAMSVARGVFHPKVAVLAWESRIRLLVGSANVTEPGYRTNLEQVACLDFHDGGLLPFALLDEALRFLERCLPLSPGAERATLGAGPAALALISDVRAMAAKWTVAEGTARGPRVEWIGLVPRDARPVLAQTLARAWSGTVPSHAWVLTPFFDDGAGAKDTLACLVASMGRHGEREIHFVTTGNELPSGQVEMNVPEELARGAPPRTHLCFHLVQASSEKGDQRPLHAKSIWLERDGRVAYLVGSSNFTRAGLGYDARRCNVEANVAFVIPDADGEFGRRCEAGYPDHRDVATERITFVRSRESTPGDEDRVPLPAGFEQAVYAVSDGSPRLDLWITPDAPESFRVLHVEPGGAESGADEIVNGAAWRRNRETPSTHPWEKARPPSSLLVVWMDGTDAERRSIWPINVDDPSRLPAPDELRLLSLEELLEVLSSALPLHEAWSRLRRRRRTSAALTTILDPHVKVDTSRHLLRRMSRVAAAVEGLRERLERPAYSRDALAWRLRTGPVSPIRLAQRLAEEETVGVAFFIAEVALAVARADFRLSRERLGEAAVSGERGAVLAALRALASAHPAPANLSSYVAAVFAGSSL